MGAILGASGKDKIRKPSIFKAFQALFDPPRPTTHSTTHRRSFSGSREQPGRWLLGDFHRQYDHLLPLQVQPLLNCQGSLVVQPACE